MATEIKLAVRSRIIIFLVAVTILICSFEFFYVMINDRVLGNCLALSSWITQIYIILGITYGILISEKETQEILELMISLGTDLSKRVCKIIMVTMVAFIIYGICVFCALISFNLQKAPHILNARATEYIGVYWIMPFAVSGLLGLNIAHRISSKVKYVVGILLMITIGPMLSTLLEPLMDTRTGLYKYISIFNMGPLSTAKPINLIFGYSLPLEKKIMAFSLFVGCVILLLSGAKIKKCMAQVGLLTGTLIMFLTFLLNFKYIEKTYDYEIAMKMYEVYSQETTFVPDNHYQIQSINIDISESLSSFLFDTEFKVINADYTSYLSFMLYHDFWIEGIYIENVTVDYLREKDMVVLLNHFEAGKSYTIRVVYHGIPAIHMYADRKNWILPAYFAWYPMQGDHQNIMYQNNLYSVNFVSTQPTENIYFRVTYTGKEKPYCNLIQNELHGWDGYSKGVTLLNSEWMKIEVINEDTYIYPLLCKNYATNVNLYASQFHKYNEVLGEEHKEKHDTYMFLCDTTYTGHGETIRIVGNQVFVEITRAYINGNELMNPNLGIYALIKEKYLHHANDVLLEYIFKCALISSLVKTGQLDQEVLVRDLDDLYRMYHDNGYEQIALLIQEIKQMLERSDETQERMFFETFADILNSEDGYEINDILNLFER